MKINYWKWGVIAAIVLALMYWAHSCGVRSVIVKAGRVDTVWLKPDTVRRTDSVPKLVKVIKWQTHTVILDTDVVRDVVPPFTDSSNCLEAYNSAYLYSYNERFKYGSVEINDTVSQNQFLGRGLTFILDSIPVVTKQVLIQQPKKVILYGAISVAGNKNDFGAGGGLYLKWFNDWVYGAEAKVFNGKIIYEGRVLIPIELGKK